MDKNIDDPARRGLISPPGVHGQPPQARTELLSQFQRRFSQSLFLPSMAPRLPSAASSSGSGFSYYQGHGTPAASLAAAGGGGSYLARSLSQPPFFSMNQLAPLPYDGPDSGAAAAVARCPLTSPGAEQGAPLLPPRGPGHRRSRSDFFLGFSRPNMPFSLPPTVEENTAAVDGVFELENWAKAGGRGGPSIPRHCRSFSDNSFIGNLSFGGATGQESPRLTKPSLEAGTSSGFSRTRSGEPLDGPSALFATDLANVEFSEAERKKIMANDRLAEMALTDPKRVKRILANRMSAAKSKERQVKYMGELERRVRVLQMETSTLSAKVEMELRETDALKIQNNEMEIRAQALEQQAFLKNALNEAMSAEVQRLKHVIGETNPHTSNSPHQHLGHQKTAQQL